MGQRHRVLADALAPSWHRRDLSGQDFTASPRRSRSLWRRVRAHGGLRALRAVPGLCIVIEVQFVLLLRRSLRLEGGAEALHPCVVPAPALGRHAAADLVAALIGVDQELLGFDLAVPQGPVGGCWAELLLLQVLGHTIGAVAWVPARPKPASGLGLER